MEASRGVSLLLLAIVGYCALGCCGSKIPARMDGFVYGGKPPALGETVVVEAFLDPLCPDSRDTWPPLKEVVDHYGGRVSVVVHLFPLPSHSYAFNVCQAIHTVNKLNPSYVYPLLEKVFKYQEGYYNQPTYKKSGATVVDEITKNLVVPIIGETNLPAYTTAFNDSQSDQAARISFKIGSLRAVTGTPSFVNAIPIDGSGSPVDYKRWISILDPLVSKM
ncbi:hypothetical protein HU200_006180 [Digitaria exilis]|uniref:Thioredoxin-like fold domain-containing protein n=1 Tax=Digitaria exilis TaxID=1010633 RepID=A0A835FQB2_9POAL|nr:hypothetical protein HU200_006180 [Digitaria exilis]CAB3445925.1 unnamed protein product [Digitaria exilis]